MNVISSASCNLSLDVAESRIDIKEVVSRSLKYGKTAGADGVNIEVITYETYVLDLFCFLCKLCWKGERGAVKDKTSQIDCAVRYS